MDKIVKGMIKVHGAKEVVKSSLAVQGNLPEFRGAQSSDRIILEGSRKQLSSMMSQATHEQNVQFWKNKDK